MEFFLPHRKRLCTVVSTMLCLTACSIEPFPRVAETGTFALLSHQFMSFFFSNLLISAEYFLSVRAEVECTVAPSVHKDKEQEHDEHENSQVSNPTVIVISTCLGENEHR